MNFISAANAQSTAPAAESGAGSLIMMGVLIAVFYLLIFRPQQKRVKEHTAMISNLKAGDEVVTGGGFLAKVDALHENIAVLELADGVKVKVQKPSITAVVPKGSVEQAA